MDSETSHGSSRARVILAIRDDALRARVAGLLESADLDLEFETDLAEALERPRARRADLVVLHHGDADVLDTEDTENLDRLTRRKGAPEVVVVEEGAEQAERAGMLAAGAGAVLAADELGESLEETVRTLAEPAAPPTGADDADGAREPRLTDFLSRSPVMQGFLELVQKVVPTSTSLLLTGETGVGKERLAQAIHNEGPRGGGPFVTINCGAIPGGLLESELFGHEPGAFTGATGRRRGRFEQADRGTILLDEIGEMPIDLQVRLLTVLQRQRVQRIGAERSMPIDVRVMAATNVDLSEAVRDRRFRRDLYYRLNVVRLRVLPLRERPEDVPDLVGQFLREFRARLGRAEYVGIDEDALRLLCAYSWPGNVRQLANAIEHAMVVCDGRSIRVADLPEPVVAGESEFGILEDGGPAAAVHLESSWLDLPIHEARREVWHRFEHTYLERLLRETGGRIRETADRAGIVPRSLYDKLRKHGLDKKDFR